MHHVFISYNRQDGPWVDELARWLRAKGHPVWIDQQDIPVSLPWFAEVTDAIGEADLFLVCDSPRWQSSPSCRAEHQIAADSGKVMMSVAVGPPVAVAGGQIVGVLRAQPKVAHARVELTVLARDWDRGSRPRGALVSRRRARQLRRSAHVPPGFGPVERAFLRASRARSRRRAAIATVVGLTVGCSLLGWAVISALRTNITKANAAQSVAYAQVDGLRINQKNDPVRVLSDVTRLGGNEAMQNATYISQAFLERLPNDAFTVAGSPRRFVTDPIVDEVVVADAKGGVWHRSASAPDVRKATAWVGPSSLTDVHATVAAKGDPDSGAVTITRSGAVWRRIYFGRRALAVSVSPNGRELAATTGNSISIADIAGGSVKTTLRGRGDAFRDVAWSADGNRVWAIGRGQVVSWSVRDGVVLRDSPSRRFEAVLPGRRAGEAWVVSSSGGLEELDVTDGRHLASLRVPDTITAAGAAPDGTVAALSGKRGLWIVPLTAGAPRLVSLGECRLGRATFADATRAEVPCINGPIVSVDTSRATIVGRRRNSVSGAFAVKALPNTDALLSSDTIGDLFVSTPDGRTRMIYTSFCGGSITRVATSPDGRIVVPAGAGTGINGCTRRLTARGGDPGVAASWQADYLIEDVPNHLAEASAVSRKGGSFAFGYEDGTVVLHPTVNLIPTRTVTTIVGRIRDLLVTRENHLLVATAAGTLTRIDLCETCLSDRAMAGEARTILRRQIALGIAKRAPRPR